MSLLSWLVGRITPQTEFDAVRAGLTHIMNVTLLQLWAEETGNTTLMSQLAPVETAFVQELSSVKDPMSIIESGGDPFSGSRKLAQPVEAQWLPQMPPTALLLQHILDIVQHIQTNPPTTPTSEAEANPITHGGHPPVSPDAIPLSSDDEKPDTDPNASA